MAILGLLPRSRLAVAQAHISFRSVSSIPSLSREEITFCRDFRALVPERPVALSHGVYGSWSHRSSLVIFGKSVMSRYFVDTFA